MDPTSKIIFVTGATGQQGGAVARHLLTANWRVRALVRDPLWAHDAGELLAQDWMGECRTRGGGSPDLAILPGLPHPNG
jgi:uncharacterized protein YbjT (DUF2867 family)